MTILAHVMRSLAWNSLRPAPGAPPSRTRRRAPLGVVLLAATVLGGCAFSNLDYVQDDRVKILEPETNETVSLPFDVVWDVEDWDGRFAVFFDRSPMRPGRDLRSLVPDDDTVCHADPQCPDADWLAARGVYVTAEPRLTVAALPDLRDSPRHTDRHDLVIVLLDETGRRVRESAFIREFIVHRED